MTAADGLSSDGPGFIDPGPVRAMREQEEGAAAKLREQIAQLQEQLAVREARIAVLDEVLSRCQVELDAVLSAPAVAAAVEAPPPVFEPPRSRATASSMADRREAVVRVFRTHGDLTPKDLLPLVNDALGEELLAHQLRAVLRKYKKLFESRPDQHGVWGLVSPL